MLGGMFSSSMMLAISAICSLFGEGGGSIRRFSNDKAAIGSIVLRVDLVGVKSRSSWCFVSSMLVSASPNSEATDRFVRERVLDATDEQGDGSMIEARYA